MTDRIRVGDRAPLFSLLSEEGEIIDLGGHIGLSPIVLYFYPKDNTAICTKEAQAFRDNFDQFRDIQDTMVFGISSDSVASHKQFSSDHALPFTLLSDRTGEVRKLYSVAKTLGLLPGRVTYVIDKKGIVKHIYSSQLNYQKHIEEALSALKSLKDQ